MASPNLLKVHEVTKVTPSSNSTSEFSLPLTFFDTLYFKLQPAERLFFYQPEDLTPHFFNSVILPKLKHSLSIALFHYLPLAGNLLWPSDAPKPAVHYFPGDGVSVTVAESNADFNFLSGNGAREVVEFHPLIPQLLISDDKAAAIAIQITSFPNQGFCIGIATHHAILDGKSSTMFMKSWAYLCNQDIALSPELTPCFDRSVIKDPAGRDMVYVKNWMALSRSDSNPNYTRSLKLLPRLAANSDLVQATFELTPENINKLRDKILSTILDKVVANEVKRTKQLHLSTYVVSCAYVFVCIFKAIGVEGNKIVQCGFPADYRTRFDPPVPINYFGNCIWLNGVAAQARDFMGENGLSFAAEKLSDAVQGLKRGVPEELADQVAMFAEKNEQVAKQVGVAGSNRFDVYKTDFGWGRPKKAEIVSIGRVGAISLAENRDYGSGGVEVGVVLEKQEMEVFASLFVYGLKY